MSDNLYNNITIVSAFVSNINLYRNLDKYIDYGTKLLQNNLQKIIFIEKNIYDSYFSNQNFNNTHFIFFEKKDIYLYNFINDITNFSINTDNPSKDNLEYFFVQCNKTEWVKQAIEINYFNTEQFIWLDFGIFHVFNNNLEKFNNSLYALNNKIYERVRISTIWNLDYLYNINIHKNICWYFAGGIFGGSKNFLLKFAEIMKNKCISYIQEHKNLVWEVNIWYLIYNENKELFDTYHSDHNSSLIQNY